MAINGIHFAIMKEEHLEQLAALEQACFSQPWDIKSLRAELTNRLSSYIVALNEQEEIVGYAGFWHVIDEIQIMRVAVAPAYRQRGIAEKMLRKLEAEWIDYDIGNAFLEVRVSNGAAQKLYRKLGYRSEYIRKKYYSDREDAIVMIKYYNLRNFEKNVDAEERA